MGRVQCTVENNAISSQNVSLASTKSNDKKLIVRKKVSFSDPPLTAEYEPVTNELANSEPQNEYHQSNNNDKIEQEKCTNPCAH